MQKTCSLIAAAGMITLLGACSSIEYKNMNVVGSDFDKGLYDGYQMLADAEYEEADDRDGDAFGRRAAEAASGKRPAPEALTARNLPENTVGDLSAARNRLVAALNSGATDKAARDAAMAQVSFDCWMQEQEENIQPTHIAHCRSEFQQAMARVDAALNRTVAQAKPAPVAAPKKREAQTTKYVVYFDFDSAQLNQQAMDALSIVKGEVKPAAKIVIRAYADRAGATEYNDILAAKRARTVFSALEQSGVKGEMETDVFGEQNNAIPTGDGVREKLNRRVEISVTQ